MCLPVSTSLGSCFVCKPRGLLVLKAPCLRWSSDVQEAGRLRGEGGLRLTRPWSGWQGPRLAAPLRFQLQGGQGTLTTTQTGGLSQRKE